MRRYVLYSALVVGNVAELLVKMATLDTNHTHFLPKTHFINIYNNFRVYLLYNSMNIQHFELSSLLGGHFVDMLTSRGATRLVTMTTAHSHYVISGGVPLNECRELAISGSVDVVKVVPVGGII